VLPGTGTTKEVETGPDVPVMVELTVSVAVMVWFPGVNKVTGNCAEPLVSVESAGRVAAPSVLLKCTVSVKLPAV
jgi:hypothetical protein